jgi:hypothetical protein
VRMLGRLWAQWSQRTDCGFYETMGIDTHRWANRSEILRRLSAQAAFDPLEHEPEDDAPQLMPPSPRHHPLPSRL